MGCCGIRNWVSPPLPGTYHHHLHSHSGSSFVHTLGVRVHGYDYRHTGDEAGGDGAARVHTSARASVRGNGSVRSVHDHGRSLRSADVVGANNASRMSSPVGESESRNCPLLNRLMRGILDMRGEA